MGEAVQWLAAFLMALAARDDAVGIPAVAHSTPVPHAAAEALPLSVAGGAVRPGQELSPGSFASLMASLHPDYPRYIGRSRVAP